MHEGIVLDLLDPLHHPKIREGIVYLHLSVRFCVYSTYVDLWGWMTQQLQKQESVPSTYQFHYQSEGWVTQRGDVYRSAEDMFRGAFPHYGPRGQELEL